MRQQPPHQPEDDDRERRIEPDECVCPWERVSSEFKSMHSLDDPARSQREFRQLRVEDIEWDRLASRERKGVEFNVWSVRDRGPAAGKG